MKPAIGIDAITFVQMALKSKVFKFYVLVSFITISCWYSQCLFGQSNPSDYMSKSVPVVQFNDGYQNLNPVVSDNGNQIWFSKLGHPSNVGKKDDKDVWSAELKNGQWSLASNQLFGLNTELNDLVIGHSNNELIYVLQYAKGVDVHLSIINVFRITGSGYQLDHVINIPKLKFLQ